MKVKSHIASLGLQYGITYPLVRGKCDKGDLINIGSGQEVKIAYLAKLVKEAVGYEGEIVFDHSKPDGTFRRMLDSSKIQNLGWMARTELRAGLKTTYEDFLTRYGSLSK